MTMDNGMDVSPSWEELREERDALAAQVGLLSEALRKIDADLEGRNFLENSSLRDTARAAIEALPATPLARLRGEVRRQVAEEWEVGLPRLKAEWQAEALEEAADMYGHTWEDEFADVVVDIMRKGRGYIYPEGLIERAAELRRQAEEPIG